MCLEAIDEGEDSRESRGGLKADERRAGDRREIEKMKEREGRKEGERK